jgi:UDP-N-acetylmuramoylalanine--D-glutamate ligase
VSPGLSLKTPEIAAAIAAGKEVIGDIELFAQVVKKPVIGITGSNGKSTVTALLGAMAKQAGIKAITAGNIGLPILDVAEQEVDLFILELSSFQLETTHSLQLAAAAILNISEDHMDRYDSFADYVKAKQRIYKQAKLAVFNRGDSNTFCEKGGVSFGYDAATTGYGIVYEGGARYLSKGKQWLIAESELSLKGYHNVLNALAALALGEQAGLPLDAMLQALRTFQGLEHRCQLVRSSEGVAWYNDSKATNVGAAIAAIKSLAQGKNVILIAGGDGKGADFSPLKAVVDELVKELILFGKDKALIKAVCQKSVEVDDLSAAIVRAKATAQAGDVVLLAPACASLDMFDNFQHRGDVFTQLVKQI